MTNQQRIVRSLEGIGKGVLSFSTSEKMPAEWAADNELVGFSFRLCPATQTLKVTVYTETGNPLLDIQTTFDADYLYLMRLSAQAREGYLYHRTIAALCRLATTWQENQGNVGTG